MHAITTQDGGHHVCSCGLMFPVGQADEAYRHARAANANVVGPECKVCGAKPDSEGCIEHGRGCYVVSEDGGGVSFVDVATDQPPPIATDRRPCWDIVIDLAAKMRGIDGYGRLHDVVLEDMRQRDSDGRAKYGVPLTAGNGRNHLVDAYQEYLDGAVYLAAWLDERGVTAETYVSSSERADAWTISCVQQMLYEQLRDIVRLRAFIDSEAKRAVDALSAKP